MRCIITYSDPELKELITEPSEEPYTCIVPASKQNQKSQTFLIGATFDGNETLGHPLTFTVIAPPPTVSEQNCFISNDGLSIVIMFERPIDLMAKEMKSKDASLCTHLLTLTTLKTLNDHDVTSCVWSSKVQFMIYMSKPIAETTIDIIFNTGVLKEDAQVIAKYNDKEVQISVKKLTTQWLNYIPKLVITGPSEIPKCGVFALTGHFSSPSGTLGFKFSWSVRRSDNGPIDQELTFFIASVDKQNLILDSIAFEVGASYEMTLSANGPSDQKLSATHRIVKFDYDAPIVSIFSSIMLPQAPLTVDQMAIFYAETYVPVCVYPFQRVGLFWKVIDPRVKFNFSLAYSPVYVVDSYSLPQDLPITFYISAFLGHRVMQTSGAGFTIISKAPHLKAIIDDGSPMATLGVDSGWFEVSGERSATELRRQKLVYQWTCIDTETHQPCYVRTPDMKRRMTLGSEESTEDHLLVNRTMQHQTSLLFHSSQFQPNRELLFSLQVFDANDTTRISETELILVKPIEGQAPQVFMGSIYVNGNHRATLRSPQNLAILVPAHTALVIKGRAKHPKGIKQLRWESPNFIQPLHWVNQMITPFEIMTELHIHPGNVYILVL